MRIHIKTIGIIRNFFDADRLAFDLPQGATLKHLLDSIAEKYAHNLPDFVWNRETHRFQYGIVLLGNNTDLRDEEVPLIDDQEIILLQPVHGG